MKQLQQSLKSGQTEIVDIPVPRCGDGEISIQSRCSLISAGTERMLIEFGKAGILGKARQQPDKVRQVIEKARTDGVVSTIKTIQSKLNTSIPMGYSNVGVVHSVGTNVQGYNIGDRVVSNGSHAEMVVVPQNLVAHIPDKVSDENASFAIVAAIALQGVRLADVKLGERVAVIGLGLIGLLTVQTLRAQGCQVIGLDFDSSKLTIAESYGAEVIDLAAVDNAVDQVMSFSSDQGVDAVILTTATDSDEPIQSAARMSRKRGRIILVGTAGLNFSRDDFYKKELSFQVSCSYGPGRYDQLYEQGQDYPFGYVRWTEQRNFEAVLQLMAEGKIDPSNLLTHRFPFEQAVDAYTMLGNKDSAKIGLLLEYPSDIAAIDTTSTIICNTSEKVINDSPKITFIGAGNYASDVLIPAFRSAGAKLHGIASRHGLSATNAAHKFGFVEVSSDISAQIKGAADAIVITTQHDSHANLVMESLWAGKHVFVEKPLCLNQDELDEIKKTLSQRDQQSLLMVGFNRRFAPLVKKMKSLLQGQNNPKSFIYTINAGIVPPDHWTQDKDKGGGRIIGEACHFVDLLRFLANSPIKHIVNTGMTSNTKDTVTLTLGFADGSIGTIHYFANGHRAIPKERLEVFIAGKTLHLDNFRKLRGYGWQGFSSVSNWSQDKGQSACAQAFLSALKEGGPAPIPLAEIIEVTQQTLNAVSINS